MEREFGVSKAREKFADLIEQVQYQGDTIVISRNGKPAAAVVPMEIYENWKQQRKEFFSFIRQLEQRASLEPDKADDVAAEAVMVVRKQNQNPS